MEIKTCKSIQGIVYGKILDANHPLGGIVKPPRKMYLGV